MKKEPFIITLQHYDTKISIEKEYSDVTMEELYEMFRALALAAGYSTDTVNEYFEEP